VALFDPKAQAALPAAQRYGGLGINLPVVKQIITSLGGKVWVESQKGEGTIFHFTLPIKSRI
jgi:signal transduction histidine kinase